MCATCGCETTDEIKLLVPGEKEAKTADHVHNHHDHDHNQAHMHDNSHHTHMHTHDSHAHSHTVTLDLERDVLQKNNLLAERNREFFEARNILALNLVSSPGSGKTTLLEKTIHNLAGDMDFYIIEGDQQTMNDANRIASAGAPVVQVNTGKGCHLDSDMIYRAIKKLNPKEEAILLIENVGNLVCPSLFDLGENQRVVIMSVTEGEDKPLKYPTIFETSNVCIINKTDLLPYVQFDIEKAVSYLKQVNPVMEIIQVSATTEHGLEAWYAWLKQKKGIEHIG